MYYISKVNEGTVDITDTEDNVTERYSMSDVRRMNIPILGVLFDSFKVYSKRIVNIVKHSKGEPCRISYDGGKTYKQSLYMGYESNLETLYFLIIQQ